MRRLKRDGKKGFTLVELIVVLVILAILAALLIPALTGYINKAKEKQITAETRQVVMAAQTLVDEYYGQQPVGTITADQTIDTTNDLGTVTLEEIAKLAEVDDTNIQSITVGGTGDLVAIITKVEYKKDGKLCTYEKATADAAGSYKITDATP